MFLGEAPDGRTSRGRDFIGLHHRIGRRGMQQHSGGPSWRIEIVSSRGKCSVSGFWTALLERMLTMGDVLGTNDSAGFAGLRRGGVLSLVIHLLLVGVEGDRAEERVCLFSVGTNVRCTFPCQGTILSQRCLGDRAARTQRQRAHLDSLKDWRASDHSCSGVCFSMRTFRS